MIMLTAWKIRNTYRTHGIEFTVSWANRQGINPDTVCYALTGHYLPPAPKGV